MFDTVLVANRGEVSVRITRTLRRLGVRSVAVHSDADAGALHVREADVAVRLGPAPARESYLSVERLLEAAARTGAQAVHPGYGFLAENAAFARAVADAGLVFIGPTPEAIEAMGDKIRAKEAVARAGVPVVPGASSGDLLAAADEVGYPVLVKPSAGGGGKGMRLVHDRADLPAALDSARREAAASFGDDTLLLERFVLRPRHVEVQVLADAHGTTLHLGERECSLQRRHQKVVEEAPSPLLSPAQRERYGALAVATAEAVGYTGAGTVELIVAADAPDEPFFMEMNTRLQVEHPVTEMVTGLDLVELQVRVAAGERLPLAQSDVVLRGHAVEARLYAEDPARGFLPTGGPALRVREASGPGVRVDSSLVEGSPVGTTYDPMLAKVVAHGPDRATALARLDRALGDTVLLGCTTNAAFLRALVTHPEVLAGRLDTDLLERSLDDLVTREVPREALAAFALTRLRAARTDDGPWGALTGWRAGGPAAPLHWDVLDPDGERLRLSAEPRPGGALLHLGGDPVAASLDGDLLTVDGRTTTLQHAVDGATTWVHLDGATHAVVEAPPLRLKGGDAVADGEVRSPMPGAVTAVHAAAGDAVAEGAPLLAVEAMKMEHVLRAPVSGTLELLVRVGDQVVVDQPLARVTPGEDPS